MKQKILLASAIFIGGLTFFFANNAFAETYEQCMSGCLSPDSGMTESDCQGGCAYLLNADGTPNNYNYCDGNYDSPECCQKNGGYWNNNTCNTGQCDNNFETPECCVANGGFWSQNQCQNTASKDDLQNASAGTCTKATEQQVCGSGYVCNVGANGVGQCVDAQTYLNYNSAGSCTKDSDCGGGGFICVNNSCTNQQAYSNYLSAGGDSSNSTKSSSGSSIGSSAKSAWNSTIGKVIPSLSINVPSTSGQQVAGVVSTALTLGNYSFPAGTQLYLNSNGTATAVSPSGSVISSAIPGTVLKAVLGSSSFRANSSAGGLASGGTPNQKCGANFQDIGGVCFPMNTGLSEASISMILANIFGWLMGLFTTLAVVAFIISGIQYLTSAGDEKQAESAKRNAKYALIGIIVGLSGYIAVKAIASALSGQSIFF